MTFRRCLLMSLVAAAVVLASARLLALDGQAGGVVVRLTATGQDCCPVFSPDGRRIAFFRAGEGRTDVAVMDADGSRARVLTDGAPSAVSFAGLAWSPDGKRILFVSATGPGLSPTWDVFVVAADGTGDPVNLTNLPSSESWPPNRATSARWSPNGRKIVFAVNSRIWVMDADGGGAANVSSGAHNDPHDCSQAMDDWSPIWSPDGREIAFLRVCGIANQESHLYVMNADGSDTTLLSQEHGYDHWDPAWSPNGRYISIASALHAEQGSILVIDRKNATEANVSQAVPSWGPAAWSPDGRRIAFINAFANAMYLVNADGSELAPLLDRSYVSSPSWSRNGRRIGFQLTVNDDQVSHSDLYVISVAPAAAARARR